MHNVADREYLEPEPHQKATFNLSTVTGITLTEVISLSVIGWVTVPCGTCAPYWKSINVEYLRLRPDEFQDYKEWFWVERFKEQKYLRNRADEIFKQLDRGGVKEIEDKMTRVRSRFEKNEVRRHEGTEVKLEFQEPC